MKKLNLYNCDGGNQRTEAKREERITKQKKKCLGKKFPTHCTYSRVVTSEKNKRVLKFSGRANSQFVYSPSIK